MESFIKKSIAMGYPVIISIPEFASLEASSKVFKNLPIVPFNASVDPFDNSENRWRLIGSKLAVLSAFYNDYNARKVDKFTNYESEQALLEAANKKIKTADNQGYTHIKNYSRGFFILQNPKGCEFDFKRKHLHRKAAENYLRVFKRELKISNNFRSPIHEIGLGYDHLSYTYLVKLFPMLGVGNVGYYTYIHRDAFGLDDLSHDQVKLLPNSLSGFSEQ